MMTNIETPTITLDEREALDLYRIVRVDVPRYDVDGYRYSTLKDAVAQAKRASSRI